jgi:leucyl-tRNA synthetase
MYDHESIEAKWRQIWRETNLYKTGTDLTKPKYYILDMFPYPSGVGLHVGHPKGYIATDILARLKMMQGFNVLHPMGFDAFGLPAENYAIKNKVHPRVAVEKNIAVYKKQLESLGFTYDWEKEIDTTDPKYYKWTQWAFLKMFEKGLVYESSEPINFCPSCKTGLANEDLEDGKCERCGSEIEQKPMRQWVIRITDYAERLLNDLEDLPEWEDSIKEMQKNWIGKSGGAEIIFQVKDRIETIKVFTTRVDTIFGCTYVVLAPDATGNSGELLNELKDSITNWEEIEAYRETVAKKTNLERTDLNKDKTGVKVEGLKAINPFNDEEIEIFVADYVLGSYGTGMVMAVPAHDERDYEFAQKYQIKIKTSILPTDGSEISGCFPDDGVLTGSGEFSGLESAVAREEMMRWLKEKKLGGEKINYKIKDWVFSRQRYWGEPIPIVHCDKCGAVALPYEDLPLILPEVESYEPSGTGESPLANITAWVNTTCPQCGGAARRETNTMPQWAGSSWYYLRYIDPKNDEALVDKEKEKYWSPVDFCVGGAEHATRHLIYARFWHKFLFDIGAVNYKEPFKKLQHVGLIIGADGQKMSKRWGNVVNPDEIVKEYGADALRVYEMFMGPFGQETAWNSNGVSGSRKFLERLTTIKIGEKDDSPELKRILHKTIKKVTADINDFRFNTAISALMILMNEISNDKNLGVISQLNYKILLQIIAPFAPHLAEELWSATGETTSIFHSVWPEFDEALAKDDKINLAVQVNGKLRATLEVAADIDQAGAQAAALEDANVKKWVADQKIIKVIFVKGKLVNIVV